MFKHSLQRTPVAVSHPEDGARHKAPVTGIVGEKGKR